MNSEIKRPGTQFESNVDGVGMHVGKKIIDVIKIKVKKIFGGKINKPN